MMVVLRTKWFKIFWRQCFWSYTCKCISQMLSILIIACYISDIDWLQHWCRCNIFRARLTLPQSMQAVDLPGQEVAVLTQGPISKNTHYGPFEAKKTTHEFSDDSLFLLKVVQQLMILELLVRLLMESFFNFLYFMPCSLSQLICCRWLSRTPSSVWIQPMRMSVIGSASSELQLMQVCILCTGLFHHV